MRDGWSCNRCLMSLQRILRLSLCTPSTIRDVSNRRVLTENTDIFSLGCETLVPMNAQTLPKQNLRVNTFLLPIFCIALLFPAIVRGQSKMRFDHISVKQQLSQGNVWDIEQDRLGFIWLPAMERSGSARGATV